MAFGDVVQAVEATGNTGEMSISFSAPAAGNLLVLGVGRAATHGIDGAWDTPSGWTKISDTGINNGNIGAIWFYKIAVGDETSAATTDTNEAGNWRAVVVEFTGPFAVSPLDQSTEDESHIASVVTSQASGTTGNTAQASELAVAFFVADGAANVDGSRTYSNSFTERIFSSATTSTARASSAIASRVLTSVGTYSTTFACTDTGDEMYGAIATFKAGSSSIALTVAGSDHAHAAESMALVQHNILAVQDGTHAHLADGALAIIQHGAIVAQDAAHGHAADSPTLTAHEPATQLAVQDAAHGHTAESPALVQHGALVVSDSLHAHAADNLALVQANILAVQDAAHGHAADSPTLTAHAPGGVTLSVADSSHGHAADNVTLTQHSALIVQDATHAHAADQVTLSYLPPAWSLTVQDALHAHAADGDLALVQTYSLTVADSGHLVTSDTVGLTQHNSLTLADAFHLHSADNLALQLPGSGVGNRDVLYVGERDTLTIGQRSTLMVKERKTYGN